MSHSIETLTICGEQSRRQQYMEFEDKDGEMMATAMIEAFGSKEAAIEEMLYLTIIAASRDDKTTINGLAAARKYWRNAGRNLSHPAPQRRTRMELNELIMLSAASLFREIDPSAGQRFGPDPYVTAVKKAKRLWDVVIADKLEPTK